MSGLWDHIPALAAVVADRLDQHELVQLVEVLDERPAEFTDALRYYQGTLQPDPKPDCNALHNEPDYITVVPAVQPHQYNTVIMRKGADDEWSPHRVSVALSEKAAQALAKSWAEVLKLEIR